MKKQFTLVCAVINAVTTKILWATGFQYFEFLQGEQDIAVARRVIDIGFELIQRRQPLSRKAKLTREVDFVNSIHIIVLLDRESVSAVVDIEHTIDLLSQGC